MINKNHNSFDQEDFIERDLQIAQLWKKLPYDEKIKWNETAITYELKNNQKSVSKSELKLFQIYCKNYLTNNLSALINELETTEDRDKKLNINQILILKFIEKQHIESADVYERIKFVVKCLDEVEIVDDNIEKKKLVKQLLLETKYSSEKELKSDWEMLLTSLDFVFQEKFKDLNKLEKFSLSFSNRQILNLLPLIPNAKKFINDYNELKHYLRISLSLFEIFYFENLKTIDNPLTYFQNLMKHSVPVLRQWENIEPAELDVYKEKFLTQRFGTLVSPSLLKVLKTSAYVLNLRNKFYYWLLKEKTINIGEIDGMSVKDFKELEHSKTDNTDDFSINKINSPTLFQDINNEWEQMMQDNTLRANSDILNKKINAHNKNKEIKEFSETILLIHKYDKIAKLENLSAFHYYVEINYPYFKDILFLLAKSRKDELKKNKDVLYPITGSEDNLREQILINDRKSFFSSGFYDFYDFQLSNIRKMILLRAMINQWKELPEKEKTKYILLKDIIKSQINCHKTTSFESKEKRVFFDTLNSQQIVEKQDFTHPVRFKNQKRVPLEYDILQLYENRRKSLISYLGNMDKVIEFKDKVFSKYDEDSWRKLSAKPNEPIEYIKGLLDMKPNCDKLQRFPKFKDYFHAEFPNIYRETFENSEFEDMKAFENAFNSIETGIPILKKILDEILNKHVGVYERELSAHYMDENTYKNWESTLDFSYSSSQISLPMTYRSSYNYYRHVIQGLENCIFKFQSYSQNVLPADFQETMKEKVRKVSQVDVPHSDRAMKLFREFVHWSNIYKLKNNKGKITYVSSPTPKLFYLKSNNPNHQIIKVIKKFPDENVNKIINRVLHNAYMFYYRHGKSDTWLTYREQAESCETDTHELDFCCYLEMQEMIQKKRFEKLSTLLNLNSKASIIDCVLTKADLEKIVLNIKAKYDETVVIKQSK
ncbi:hypothetical protein QEN19_003208 [Hanseniaspora menglaensis]